MPRSLVLGNGGSFLSFDKKGLLRDFYFHYVGHENQMFGCTSRVGVYVDNKFSLISSDDWESLVNYEDDTLVGSTKTVNRNLQLELTFQDALYNEKNIFVRKVTVENKSNVAREIKVFFNHQFHMYESIRGDTAYFDPHDSTIVHYKGRRVAIIGGQNGDKSFDDYSVGLFGWGGHEGTWKDAEDGVLSKNPIEHGPVDSTIGFHISVEAESTKSFYIYICFERGIAEARALIQYIAKRKPETIIQSTSDYWRAWVHKTEFPFKGLPEGTKELFKKSLLIVRSHVDSTGAIIASGDSDMLQFGHDTYSYVWPRDASYIASALDLAHYSEVSRSFFLFANEVISEEGYFHHKYVSDKSLGSSWHPFISDGVERLPIQEDETASVLNALWKHYQSTRDLEFIEKVYNSLIKKAANFILGFRDGKTQLPSASYDLWEMKYGMSTYTSSVVYAALIASARFAELLGKKKDASIYFSASTQVKEAIIQYLYNDVDGSFYKHINSNNGELMHDATIDISSFFGLFRYGVLDVHDPKLEKFYSVVEEKLKIETEIGGFARFEQDVYYKSGEGVPGNPWFISVFWVAQYLIARSTSISKLEEVNILFEWALKYSLKSGVMSEQINPFTGEQLSASPLVWSHAEYIISVIEYIKKRESLT